MRTHLVGVALASAILFAAQTSNAQEVSTDRPVQVGFLLGGEKTTGTFASGGAFGFAWIAGVQAQVPLPVRRLAFRSDIAYHGYVTEHCVFAVQPGGGSSDCGNNPLRSVLSLSADLVVRLNDPKTSWSPYLLGGGAFYSGSSKVGGLPSSAGVQEGFGFEIRPARRWIVFAEWRHMGMGSGGMSAVTLGARF